MDDYRTVTTGVEADNVNTEVVVGNDLITFNTWGSRFKFLDGVDLSFEAAKELVKIINKTIKLAQEEEKKL